uniref:Peptidase M20 dimerisation domain-containing protein n=1 Tax=Rhizochromulina marina TaxID=1034831 RepID=A0A7S2SSC7_9STRA|mmetsp:Transcript_6127/g.17905  ORF Transcript_6127/g.17905 Transcript_6127/m.17905 type:complete len:477 (+) Transcript_6127:38-1468(+)
MPVRFPLPLRAGRALGENRALRKSVTVTDGRARRLLATSVPGSREDFEKLLKRAAAPESRDFIVGLRRKLHENPELMYQEMETSATVQAALTELGVRFSTGWGRNTRQDRIPGQGGTGVVAEIGPGGRDSGPCVALRADMDALPVEEHTSVPFKSKKQGLMHACGHDGHTAMLLGAARVLKEVEASGDWTHGGTVRLIFQPAEEGGAGAKRMCEEGVLDQEPKVQRCFGFHLWPTLGVGEIGGRPGTLLSSSDKFDLVITGKGGHAAMPHLAVDPVVTSSLIITAAQTLISRETSPLESSVVSFTKVEAGDAYNVIPNEVRLRGTLRSTTEEGLTRLRQRLLELVNHTCQAHYCELTEHQFAADYYPPTVNDPSLWSDFVEPVAGVASSSGRITEVPPTMGGEDFSFFAARVPSAFLLLGQGDVAAAEASTGASTPIDTTHSLHHPCFAINEDVLVTGAALHSHLALQSLKSLTVP